MYPPTLPIIILEPSEALNVYLDGNQIGIYTTKRLEGVIALGKHILRSKPILHSSGHLKVDMDSLLIFEKMIKLQMKGRVLDTFFKLDNVILKSINFEDDPPAVDIVGYLTMEWEGTE